MKNSLDGETGDVYLNLKDIVHLSAAAVKPFIFRELTMITKALQTPRFIRKTQLGANEYRKNFHQLDNDIIAAITSAEADQVTPLMSKIYLRLINAPAQYWEREGVLRFEAEMKGGGQLKAWVVFCKQLGVASATAHKAIRWMHEKGIIGYFAGKNGVGLRIFLNRASSSIGTRQSTGEVKILEFNHASPGKSHASFNEPAFKDTFGDLEVLDTDVNRHAPENGAEARTVGKSPLAEASTPPESHPQISTPRGEGEPTKISKPTTISADQLLCHLRDELEPSLRTRAEQAAAREHERTRQWLEKCGIPKAARVAQREAYNVLRQYGVINPKTQRTRSGPDIGQSCDTPVEAKPLSPGEIREVAESCISMLEVHGQAINVTLDGMKVEAGGYLLPEDLSKARELAQSMVDRRGQTE